MDIIVRTLEQYFIQSGMAKLPFYIKDIDSHDHNDGIHCHDYFQIIFIDEGAAKHDIEYDEPLEMSTYSVSVVFPKQIHKIRFAPGCKGKILMFDEALFCSDILKKELSAYNVELYKKLNYIQYDALQYEKMNNKVRQIRLLYDHISPIKREQIRFYIKILLLQLIEEVHENTPNAKTLRAVNVYAEYKELIEEQYCQTKRVTDYARIMGISAKRLNAICKKEAGMTAQRVLHERLIVEAKRMLLFSDESIKEIAYKLGFSSPSAFNKFIYSKMNRTPTELKDSLSQNYNQKD